MSIRRAYGAWNRSERHPLLDAEVLAGAATVAAAVAVGRSWWLVLLPTAVAWAGCGLLVVAIGLIAAMN